MRNIILILFIICSNQVVSQAQNSAQERLEAQRVAFITNRLSLTPSEAQIFWPVYNQYKQDEKQLKQSLQRPGRIQDLSDAEVEAFLDASLDQEEKELALKRKYIEKLKNVLPVKKIARLIAAERAFKEMVVKRMNERRAGRNDQ